MRIFCVLVLLFTFSAHANGVDRGGGDRYEQELRVLGHEAAARLRELAVLSKTQTVVLAPELFALDLVAFEAVVDTTTVISTNDPVLVIIDSRLTPREASNSATEHNILVNRPMWDAPANTHAAKLAISLHEYLGVMGVDRAYELSLSFRARLEFEADTVRFKAALTEQLKDLGRAFSETFRQSFEPVFARFETMQTTSEYRRCIDKRHKEAKPQELADCFAVVTMIQLAAKASPADPSELSQLGQSDAANVLAFTLIKNGYHCGWEPPRAVFNRLFDKYKKWQVLCPRIDEVIAALEAPRKISDDTRAKEADARFLAFAEMQTTPARKAFALARRDGIVAEYNDSTHAVSTRVRGFRGDADKACPGDLAEGIRCAVPLVLNQALSEVQPDMVARRKHLEQTVDAAVTAVQPFTE